MVDDEEETTNPATEKAEAMADSNGTEGSGPGEAEKPREVLDTSPKAPELSTEVRAKLRKLEKLESRYQGTIRGMIGRTWSDVIYRTFEIISSSTFQSSFD